MNSRNVLRKIHPVGQRLSEHTDVHEGPRYDFTIFLSEQDLDDVRAFMNKPWQASAQRAVWNLLKEWFEGEVTDSPTTNFPLG